MIKFVIWSQERVAWWLPESAGYTVQLAEAGLYSEAESRAIVENPAINRRPNLRFVAPECDVVSGLVREIDKVADKIMAKRPFAPRPQPYLGDSRKSFDDNFSAARTLGAAEFIWRGTTYHTRTVEEERGVVIGLVREIDPMTVDTVSDIIAEMLPQNHDNFDRRALAERLIRFFRKLNSRS